MEEKEPIRVSNLKLFKPKIKETYFINADKKMVICTIVGNYPSAVGTNVMEMLSKNCGMPFNKDIFHEKGKSKNKRRGYLIHERYDFRFTGRAICLPEDEFDPKVGKKIAFGKAKKKLYRRMAKRFGNAELYLMRLTLAMQRISGGYLKINEMQNTNAHDIPL